MLTGTIPPVPSLVVQETRAFASNAEFFREMFRTYKALLEWAAARRSVGESNDSICVTGVNVATDLSSAAEPIADENDARALYHQNKSEFTQRLAVSVPTVVPFVSLVERFSLDEFEQDVICLLFLKATSQEFRFVFEKLHLSTDTTERLYEMYLGNLLEILKPGSLSEQLGARRYFSIEGNLIKGCLLNVGGLSSESRSILDVEVTIAPRIVAWITADKNQYSADCLFHVEHPNVALDHVIMPEDTKNEIVRLAKNHEECLNRKESLGIDEKIQYGRALAILEFGPPGTGKTLFAKALATHLGKPLVSLIGGRSRRHELSFLDIEDRLPDLFREAQIQDGIVFIDECEWVCSGDSQDLRSFLTLLERSECLVILATNKPHTLDASVDRRCSVKLRFTIPDRESRKRIWQVLIPSGIELTPDVDFEELADRYPFAGGYIKNAILTATNLAIARATSGRVTLSHEDLETAAKLQGRRVGSAYAFTERRKPQVQLDSCPLTQQDKSAIQSLSRMILGYRSVQTNWFPNDRRPSCQLRGLKALVTTRCEFLGLRICEALASECRTDFTLVRLRDIIQAAHGESALSESRTRSLLEGIFDSTLSAEHILVLDDNCDFAKRIEEKQDDDLVMLFAERFARYEGVALYLERTKAKTLLKDQPLFHERIRITEALPELSYAYLVDALSGGIPLAEGIDLETLARRYPVNHDEAQQVVQKASLIAAVKAEGFILDTETLEQCLKWVRTSTNGTGALLFG